MGREAAMQNLAKDAFCILEKERNRKQPPQGLRNMIEVNLALYANAYLLFISTIGVLQGSLYFP